MTVDINQARQALYRFCAGKERMCVPAQPDDMILYAALDELETFHRKTIAQRQTIGGLQKKVVAKDEELKKLREEREILQERLDRIRAILAVAEDDMNQTVYVQLLQACDWEPEADTDDRT